MTNETGLETSPERPRRRWPTVLLALSLTLNLAVLGVVAGAHFRQARDIRHFSTPDHSMMRSTGFGPFFDAMPREARNRMGPALTERQDIFAPDRRILAAELRDMLAVIRAEPFEPGALETVLIAQQARASARIEAGRAVLIEQIATMSPRERRAFADQIEGRFARAIELARPRRAE